MIRQDPMDRLMRYVEPDLNSGCWLWTGTVRQQLGYGRVWFRNKMIGAHVLSWILHRGEIPAGMNVLHGCDTPACVNPAHLHVGTHLDNSHEMVERGRCRSGGFRQRLDADTIEQIAAALRDGKAAKTIARALNVGTSTVCRVRDNKLSAANLRVLAFLGSREWATPGEIGHAMDDGSFRNGRGLKAQGYGRIGGSLGTRLVNKGLARRANDRRSGLSAYAITEAGRARLAAAPPLTKEG